MKPITIGLLATAAFLLCGEARAQALLSAAELEKLMVGKTVRFHQLVSGVFHGTGDDWTAIGPCRAHVERLRQAGRDAALLEYAGARHAFDVPRSPAAGLLPDAINPTNCVMLERNGSVIDPATGSEWHAGAKCVSRRASVRYDAEAHRKLLDDVQGFLKTQFGMN